MSRRHQSTGGDTPPVPSYHRDPEAPTPNQPRRTGVLFVVEIGGEVLLDRRADDGAWAFTGGALERHETVLEAVGRELDEETGLRGTPTFLGIFSHPTRIVAYPDGNVTQILSLAFVVSVLPGSRWRKSEESADLRLFTRKQLRDVDLWPMHRQVRDAYLAFDGTPIVS